MSNVTYWTKRCSCGRGILPDVAQCSYCDELDDRYQRRKVAVQQQRRLNKAPLAVTTLLQHPDERKVAEMLNRSFHVGFQNRRPKHLASYQRELTSVELLQELLGGYVFDQSLWDYTDGPRNGWLWNSRQSDIYGLLTLLYPLLGAEKQLYLLNLNMAPT